MSQHFRFDASRSLTALEQDSTIVAVIEMSQTKWLVAALVPGVERQPLKKQGCPNKPCSRALTN
jgi:transposase